MNAPEYGNQPTKSPDLEGMGRAWKITNQTDKPDYEASIAAWLVHAPHGNPMWPWYCVGSVHLRDIEGQSRPPHKQFEEATHEILFLALNPEKPIPDVDAWEGMSHLTPIDFVHQFVVPEDEHARELTELVVKHILAGWSPDQDLRQYWHGVIEKTAEHYAPGGHA